MQRARHFAWAALVVAIAAAAARAEVAITGIRLIDYSIPLKSAFVTSRASSTTCYGVFILIDAQGADGRAITALGDALPRSLVTYEYREDAWQASRTFRELLLGRKLGGESLGEDTATVRRWMEELKQASSAVPLTGSRKPPAGKQLRATLCGWDIALLDLVGQVHGVPAYEVLGGKARESVAVSAPTFSVTSSTEELVKKVGAAHKSYAALRMKIGSNPPQDLSNLAGVAKKLVELGRMETDIWVDVNQAWGTAAESIAQLKAIRTTLAEAGFAAAFLCEQPVVESDLPALAEVTRAMRELSATPGPAIRILADEAVWDVEDAKRVVELDAADLINIKVQKAGGLTASMDIARYVREAAPHMGVYVGGLVMTDVGATANLQLGYALPRLDYITSCSPRRNFEVNVAAQPLAYETARTLKHPAQPGLGTGLDVEALRPFVRRVEPAGWVEPAKRAASEEPETDAADGGD